MPSPWDRFRDTVRDGFKKLRPSSAPADLYLIAATPTAVASAMMRHAQLASRPLTYEASIAVELLAREGARVAVALEREPAASLVVLAPTVRSVTADTALQASGLCRVLSQAGDGYEEWVWW